MYKVADDLRSRLIVSMGKDLGWRIGDFSKIRKDQLPDLEQEAPILFEPITEKEDVIAKSFLSQETVDLLKEYLPTVENNPNPHLFPSNTDKHFDEECARAESTFVKSHMTQYTFDFLIQIHRQNSSFARASLLS